MTKGIVHQAKDVLFRSLNDLFKDQLLDVYGLHLPRIKERLSGDLPEVQANVKVSDSVFLLEDGTILVLEFESNRKFEENHLKYAEYVVRLARRYYNETNKMKVIHVAVVYSSDVQQAKNTLQLGSFMIETHAIYMKGYDGDKLYRDLYTKVHHSNELTKEELMQFILMPLMQSKEEKQEVIHKSIELAKVIEDDYAQVSIIAGILTVTDKYINEEYAKNVREWLRMTKVERIIAKEVEEAIEQAVGKAVEQATNEKTLELAKNLLDILSPEIIAEKTGLSLEEVLKLKK